MGREPPFDPHREPIAALFASLASSPAGLAAADAAERLRHDGPNRLSEAARAPLLARLVRHLTHRFALLLLAGAALAAAGEHFSPGQGMRLIAAALVAVVVINGLFGFWQETRAEQAMAAFHRMLSPQARLRRDGAEIATDAAAVVVGDVMLLREGERVPADGRLFELRGLKVDHSPITGESEPQLRSLAPATGARLDSRNLVFAGTLVTAGSGAAVVHATGDATEIGRIAGVVRDTRRVESPIRREVRHFTRLVSAIAIGLGLVFFAAGWLLGNPFWTNLVFAIGIIVANVPEGLLPTITLGLAIAGRRMARRNALIKTLESAETLGAVTVICTDKTGTLTCNDMRVGSLQFDAGEPALRVMALCTNAALAADGGARGDPTEVALLRFVDERAPGAIARLRASGERVHERPFESASREMVTVQRTAAGLEALLKGAPEVVLPRCSGAAGAQAAADRLAGAGQRVLALACKPVADGQDLDQAATAGGYRLVGLVAMHDPPRPEVAGAVGRCRRAGIRILVVSGDHPLTVAAIAREVGISGGDDAVVTGAQLAGMSQAALRRLLAG
ncbi:MAG TPA: HAD-IC family P-type ATPase, partial [Kofleriaceae bacterium]|nr:HAD-IC family P-type ATPase [Kofleriaceae bacterium]